MQSDGRIEKRASVTVPIHLVHLEHDQIAETTTTVNVSRRGARILSGRRWQPGEPLGLTSLTGEFRRIGRVIYCHSVPDGQFCVGLQFGANGTNWKDTPWLSGT
jgi:hypothetical protein